MLVLRCQQPLLVIAVYFYMRCCGKVAKWVGGSVVRGMSANSIQTIQYSTTLAISTMRNLIASRSLRRGDGLVALPSTRRNERIFGVGGRGRSKSLRTGVKLENLGKDYDPRDDTSLKAFIRMCAARATQLASELASAPA